MKGRSGLRRLAAIALMAVMMVFAMGPMPAAAGHGNPNPGIIPPASHPYGHTYGEWSNMWWQWAFAQPVDPSDPPDSLNIHPVYDSTGASCGVGQSGPVWFLAGTFAGGQPYTRYCTVPAGKALFIPIANVEDDNAWNPDWTEEQADQYVHDVFDSYDPTSMTFEIDGHPVVDLAQYAVMPDNPSTTLTLPEFTPPYLNVIQYWWRMEAVGEGYYLRTAGYYVMLAPLSAGQHTIHFTTGDGSQDITYDLTVGR